MLQKKQLLFLAIGIGVLLFVVIVSLLTSGSSQQTQSKQDLTPTEAASDASSGTGSGTSRPSSDSSQNNQQQTETWKKYSTGHITFSYPADWTVDEKNVDSIDTITVTPQSEYYDPTLPNVMIVMYSSSPVSLSDRITNTAVMGYKKTPKTFAGVPAEDLSIVLPGQKINGQTYNNMQVNRIFFQKGDIQYDVRTAYLSGSKDYKEISEILATVTVF